MKKDTWTFHMHKSEEQLAKSTISTENYPHNIHTEPGGINNPVFLVSQLYDLSITIRFQIASSM